jgi:PAT family beta-lactamase induction signal transducer AmpG
VLVVMGFILTYALSYNLWASFAFPSISTRCITKDQVAFASKIFGIFMTMAGISLAVTCSRRLGASHGVAGRDPAALGNLLYADLAFGGAGLDAFAHALLLDRMAEGLGSDERMVRLLITIAYENVSTGLAGTRPLSPMSPVWCRAVIPPSNMRCSPR